MKKTALNLNDFRQLLLFCSTLLMAGALLVSGSARSQALETQSLDPADLDALVAPIALYPDDILSVILPASTFPLDVVLAARFLEELEQDSTLQPDDAWDESIIALLNYPEILRMMNEDLDWTWALGDAVLTDRAAVLAATQDFRRRAYAAGNLQSDDKQIVSDQDGAIEIKPADPQVIYIPVYEPQEVIVYQPRPVYRYYPYSYPSYYYPYPSSYYFPSGFFWGVTSYFSIGWHSHFLHVHHYTDRYHPHYLNSYYNYSPYYYRNNVIVTVNVDNNTNVWRSNRRGGDRPQTLTSEGRRSVARTQRDGNIYSQPGIATTNSGGSGVGRLSSSGTTRGTAGAATSTTRNQGASQRQGATQRQGTAQRQGATQRQGTAQRQGTTQRQGEGATIGGVIERSPAGDTARTRSSGSIGGGSRSNPRPAPATSGARAPAQRSAPAPRSSSTLRSAPTPRSAPTQRSAPAQRSAPTPRSAPAQRSAPVQRSAPAPAPRSAPAPQSQSQGSTRSSSIGRTRPR